MELLSSENIRVARSHCGKPGTASKKKQCENRLRILVNKFLLVAAVSMVEKPTTGGSVLSAAIHTPPRDQNKTMDA